MTYRPLVDFSTAEDHFLIRLRAGGARFRLSDGLYTPAQRAAITLRAIEEAGIADAPHGRTGRTHREAHFAVYGILSISPVTCNVDSLATNRPAPLARGMGTAPTTIEAPASCPSATGAIPTHTEDQS